MRVYDGPAPPGTKSATLFPLSRIWSSFVTRFPSAVISLCTHTHGFREKWIQTLQHAARAALVLRALFRDVLKHHVDVVVEAAECANQLLVATHNHPNPGADALVNEPETRDERPRAKLG